MTTNNAPSLLLALPQDVQQRLLAGCRYEDLFSIASVCRALRDVVSDPKFTKVRLLHGFVERGVVLLGSRRDSYAVDIRSAQTRSVKVSITGGLQLNGDTTTDGRRLFFICRNVPSGPNQRLIYALDAISGQCSRFASLPPNRALSCMEWHAGRLYVAGGIDSHHHHAIVSSFCVYNEATGSWDALPDLPVGCYAASSGIIGDQLLIAGGDGTYNRLQIFDFTTGQWRLGPSLPQGRYNAHGVVSEEKLFVLDRNIMLIYDPRSDAWTLERLPFYGPWKCACVHNGRIVAFLHNGSAYERDPGGSSWSAYRCTAARDALKGPEKVWGTIRVESILLG